MGYVVSSFLIKLPVPEPIWVPMFPVLYGDTGGPREDDSTKSGNSFVKWNRRESWAYPKVLPISGYP